MSKTVKRVSKTVKRVMTVMMIGLAAMLGVEAEAHWVVVRGKCYWHSGECVRKDADPGPMTPAPSVELVASPTQVELLCPSGDGSFNQELFKFTDTFVLATPRTTDRDITERRGPNGDIISRNVEWQRSVSDALFYISSCASGSSPIEVIVREWSSVQMNLYLKKTDQIPHSIWKAEKCTLPLAFKFDNIFRGAPYVCSGTSGCHEGICDRL